MSQCTNILRYMEETGGITQAEAVTEFGCYRLSARIADLKAQGVPIKTEMVRRKNRFGEPVSFARYSIAKEAIPCSVEQ